MSTDLFLIAFALFLVLLNGFFVATEFSIVKVRRSQVESLVDKGQPRARLLLRLVENIDEYLSACQLGITVTSLGLGWLGEPAFAHLIETPFTALGLGYPQVIHTVALAISFLLITVLHIVFGELAPKSLAIQRAERVALIVAVPMDWFYRFAYSPIRLLNWAGNWVVRMMGLPPTGDHNAVQTEEELKLILRDSQESGILTQGEKDLMDNVIEFADTRVRQVMIPRGEVAFFDINKPLEDNIDVVRKSGYTRYPLCESDIDHTLGMVHVKDLLLPAKPLESSRQLLNIKRSLLFVPEMISIQGVLNEMRKKKTLLAMVVDEYGVVEGLITLEDIIEELVGEIQDEFDQEHPQIYPTKDGGYLVDGMAPIEDLTEVLGIKIQDEENDTISGHILSKLGRIAVVGDIINIGEFNVRVLQLSGLRIAKLLLTKKGDKSVPTVDPGLTSPTAASIKSKLHAKNPRAKDLIAPVEPPNRRHDQKQDLDPPSDGQLDTEQQDGENLGQNRSIEEPAPFKERQRKLPSS